MRGFTADEIMWRGGFLPTDTGRYVTELREQTRKQVANGLLNRSPGTWGPDAFDSKTGEWKIDAEKRAKILLSIEWQLRQGHTCRIECIDGPPWEWQFNTATMRRSFRIQWWMVLPWLGDCWRTLQMRYRIWRDRNIVNPYGDVA